MWRASRRLFSTPIRPTPGGGPRLLLGALLAGVASLGAYFLKPEDRENFKRRLPEIIKPKPLEIPRNNE